MQKLARGQLLNRAIQDQIKQYITANRLGADDLLPPEGQLAIDLGVSRGSVREAIKALESLGIVEVRHGDGIRVRSFNFDSILDLLSYGVLFDPDRVVEILQIRIWLEDSALLPAVAAIDDETIAELDALLDRWTAKAEARADTSAEDRSFHQLLYRGLRNESLSQLIDIFWLVYHSLPEEAMGADHDPVATVQNHRDLLDAIRGRDPVAARAKLRAHFQSLEERIARATLRMQQRTGQKVER
jgi:DNA-binding FadR family transcriptional regulator